MNRALTKRFCSVKFISYFIILPTFFALKTVFDGRLSRTRSCPYINHFTSLPWLPPLKGPSETTTQISLSLLPFLQDNFFVNLYLPTLCIVEQSWASWKKLWLFVFFFTIALSSSRCFSHNNASGLRVSSKPPTSPFSRYFYSSNLDNNGAAYTPQPNPLSSQ